MFSFSLQVRDFATGSLARTQALLRSSCVFILLFSVPIAEAVDGTDCSISSQAIAVASRLRGLKVKRSVPCKLQSKKQVEEYLRNVIKRKISSERIEYEGQIYRMLGIVPEDYDYLNGLVELYTSQLGGYYEPEGEYYAMASWMPTVMQMAIAVHELTHALQDQHFKLDEMMDHQSLTSDQLMARAALVEGDATAVMIDYSRAQAGQPPLTEEKSVSGMMLQNITGAMISASLNSAPPALQAMMIFPYVSGLNFVHKVLLKGGYPAVDSAFANLPWSTELILHPEQYLAGGRQQEAEIAPRAPGEDFGLKAAKHIYSDSLGEFAMATLLSSWIPPLQASRAAAGWNGDRVLLYRRGIAEGEIAADNYILVWVTKWDSAEDAQEFQQALISGLTRRFSTEPLFTPAAVIFSGKRFGDYRISIAGEETLLEIGYQNM